MGGSGIPSKYMFKHTLLQFVKRILSLDSPRNAWVRGTSDWVEIYTVTGTEFHVAEVCVAWVLMEGGA